jgi:glutaredoxin
MRTTLRRWAPLILLAAAAWFGMRLLQDVRIDRFGRQVAASAKAGDIVMLSSEDCRYCDAARDWFRAHRVPFSECVIEREMHCAETFRALQAPGTPTLLVRGQRVVGFNPERLAQALSRG